MTRAITVAAFICIYIGATAAAGAAPHRNARDARLIVDWSESPWPSIWSIRPDGNHRHRILRNRQNGKRPRLSPDLKWVAFDGAPPGRRR